jgi:hypothetical protein
MIAPTTTTAAQLRQAEIELLEIDAKQALTRDQPATDAIWLALLKPRSTILRRYREMLRQMEEDDPDAAQSLRGADGLALLGPLGQLVRPDPDVSALVAIGETLVAKAIMGDNTSTAMLLERIEGKPGSRKNDIDPEQIERSQEILQAVEMTVRAFSERPGDKAKDVTPSKANGHANGGITDVDVEQAVRDMNAKKNDNGRTP